MTVGITKQWQQFREPLWQTLIRNVLIAASVGTMLAVRRGNLSLIGPFTLLAMWFTLGGHYVEVVFLNNIRYRLAKTRGNCSGDWESGSSAAAFSISARDESQAP